MVAGKVTSNPLEDIAGKTKFVSPKDQLVITAKRIGVSFGD
jgi:6-phosphofructokinase 1